MTSWFSLFAFGISISTVLVLVIRRYAKAWWLNKRGYHYIRIEIETAIKMDDIQHARNQILGLEGHFEDVIIDLRDKFVKQGGKAE